jgi:hypothetical protein
MQGGIPGVKNLGGCAVLESIVRRQAEVEFPASYELLEIIHAKLFLHSELS